MSFDWSDYFRLAKELAGQSTMPAGHEARLRSAISRAYYAAFCLAKNHLRDKEGHPIPREDVHKWVRDQFKNSLEPNRNQVGHDLNRLRLGRNKADYDDSVPMLPLTTTKALKRAQRILNTLASL
jgi:uncharacterized protein (UPF0332 family)